MSKGVPQEQVFGGGGESGNRNFRCKKIRNSSGEKRLVVSVRVVRPSGIDVKVLNSDGKCFLMDMGSVDQVD